MCCLLVYRNYFTNMAEKQINCVSTDWQSGKSLLEASECMRASGIASDVEFLVGKEKGLVKAHRYILICRSPVFQAMFTSGFDKQNQSIEIPDIELSTFNTFLRFLYTDETDVTGDNVLALLYASKKYGVNTLVRHCLTFLNNGRSPDNICTILEQAHIYDEDEYLQKSIDYILIKAREVLKSSTFEDLCFQCVLKIISFDELQADERTVLEAVTRWAQHQCELNKKEPTSKNLRDVLGEILFSVRFPLLGENYFTNVVSDSDLLTDSEKVELFKFFYKPGSTVASFISRNRYATCTISQHVVPQELKPDDRYIQTCMRFANVCDDGSWYCGGEPDAITFSTNQIVWLHGALVYGSYIGEGNYDIAYSVYDESERELEQMRTQIKTSEHQLTYILMLDDPIRILADTKYTVLVKVTNPDGIDTYQGKDGATAINVGNVKFTFSKSKFSRNGTDVKMGQIPGLLFSALK